MRQDYEELMLSLTKEAQKKEKIKKAGEIEKIHEEQMNDKASDVFDSENSTYTEERTKIGSTIVNNFVSKGKVRQFQINGKWYIDNVSDRYIVRIPLGVDRWLIFKDKKPFIKVVMEAQNNYIYEIGSSNLSKINIDDDVKNSIKKSLRKNKDEDFDVKFSLNYRDSLEFLKDLLSLGSNKRNNLMDEFNNPSTPFEKYLLDIANELNINLYSSRINGKQGMIGTTSNIEIKAVIAKQVVCIYRHKKKLCEIYPCSDQRRICVNEKPADINIKFIPHFHENDNEPYYYSANPNDVELFDYIKLICSAE